MEEQFNNLSQENADQNLPKEQISMAPRWLRIVFKTWAIIGFVSIGIMVIVIVSSFLSSVKVFGKLTEISILYSLIPYGLYAGAFASVLIFLIPFFGAFKLRKWLLPILFMLALLSAINILTVSFRQFSAESVFLILWNAAIIALAVLAFFFRQTFDGSYKKLLLQIIFFVFAIPVLVIVSLSLLFPDLPAISDSDLTSFKITLPPEEQNAYYSLIKISEQIYEPTGEANKEYMDFLRGKSWDQAKADTILSANENALAEMRKATTFSYYQCRSTAEDVSSTAKFCPLSSLRASARIAGLSALSKANQNDFHGAIEDALLSVRIGQMLMDEPSTILIDYLMGDATKHIGFKTLQIILATRDVPSKVLLPRTAEIEKYLENENGLKNAFRNEYISSKNSIDFVFKKVNSNFYIQPNRFFSDMAEDARQKMALTNIPCHRLEPALKERQENLEKNIPKIVIWKLPFTRNAVLKVFKSVMMINPSTAHMQTKRCEADLLTEQIRLQIALEAYKFDNGAYPDSQADLVPEYLNKQILNPLTNTAFDYNRNTGEIMPPRK